MDTLEVTIHQWLNEPKSAPYEIKKPESAIDRLYAMCGSNLVLNHFEALAEALRREKGAAKFSPFRIRLEIEGTSSAETDKKGIDKLAKFLAKHLTQQMVTELADRLD